MPKNRRLHERCNVQADNVKVRFRGCDCVAVLRDVSLGGMSVLYTPADPALADTTACELISCRGPANLPGTLACRTVFDISELAEGRSFRGETLRRRGFAFTGITASQASAVQGLVEGSD
jgi:hypothetical protein